MGHYVELHVGRTSSASSWETGLDGPDFPLTFAKEPRIAELMLFDTSSVQEIEAGVLRRDLISDRQSALKRFRQRLPRVRAALAWDSSAGPMLEAFGQFFAEIDWPYVRLDTMDYRIVLGPGEEETFDRELDFALSALDQEAIAKAGRLFGGDGRYTPAWERLLNFVLRAYYVEGYSAVETIYRADETKPLGALSGTPYYWSENNEPGNLLAAYLPRRGALTMPQIKRAKALLGLAPQQERAWAPVETTLRKLALDCVERVKPAEAPRPLGPKALTDVQDYLARQAGALVASFNADQKRMARRLFRAMGFMRAASRIEPVAG